jgi:signal transduction histidine kinase
MKSIRQYLWLRLVIGLGFLWLLTGGALFVTMRHSLLAEFDAELELLASEVRFLLPEGQFLSSSEVRSKRTLDFYVQNSGVYFQAWEQDGLFSDRSPSLGDDDLPRPDIFSPQHVYWNSTLISGEAVRCAAVHQRLPLEGIPGSGNIDSATLGVDIVVARNRDDLDRSLYLVVIGPTIVGLLSALLCAGIVFVSVRRGLTPLDTLGTQATAIDLDSLASRFDASSMPNELVPITDRLNDLMTRMEAGFERERRFSADLAHELRTPVAEMRTIGEFSKRWPEQVEPETFDHIVTISTRMQALLERLLTMSRYEQGAAHTEAERLALAALLHDAWRPLQGAADARQLAVSFTLDEDLHIVSDPTLLGVIASNLLSNAVTYTPKAGTIRVAASIDSNQFVLCVGNDVVNVTPEDIEKFFERLWRRDASRTDTTNHGLGLSLARSCARILGFELTATLNNQGAFLEMRLCGPISGPQTAQ